MSAAPDHAPSSLLEVLWQPDASAYVLVRDAVGRASSGQLLVGMPATAYGGAARRLDLGELLRLSEAPPVQLGGTAEAAFAVLELARRSVAEGLVYPALETDGRRWFAHWAPTIDDRVEAELAAIAAAAPAVAAEAFGGDGEEAVDDLYAYAVDRIARDRLRRDRVRLGTGIPGALGSFLDGLTAIDPELPASNGYAALERRLSTWIDEGLSRLSPAPWQLALRLNEHERALRLELWLQASDDESLSLPASLLWEDGDEVFRFFRASDARHALAQQLTQIEPLLESAGIALDPDEPFAAELDEAAAKRFLRELTPQLAVPVLLPDAWLKQTRVRVNLKATSMPARSSGLLSTSELARFDWRVAVGDVELSEAELRELAESADPFVHVHGHWHSLRRTDVERALRFLERRRGGATIFDLARAVSGLELDEAGLELGEVELDRTLEELLGHHGERRFRPLPTPAAMQHALFPFQERGHGWLRMLNDLGVGAILADDMGLGKTVQAIAVLLSEREEGLVDAPTLVVCPLSVAKQWLKEISRFAPTLRAHLHHGNDRLSGRAFASVAERSDVVVTSYDVATRDVDTLALVEWDRLLLDEAQDVKNPATKRARAMRKLPARRKVAMTGTPIENRLSELWSIMDVLNPGLLGSREWFERMFARPIELHGDERAVERLRALVGPFVLRRPKDSPEVEFELPPITIEKDYCTLTVEQAALYQSTVDSWLPRIAAQGGDFGRRGAVLAMLTALKQVCNHPETVRPTGAALGGRSGKLERLVELLRAVPQEDKALVFTQYPGFDRLAPHLAERTGRKVGFFHGRLGAAAREDLLADFERAGGPAFLVVSIRAGGRGLNLPTANHVVHFDRWWNPAVEQQATDRVHRFGQHKHVYVHSLICVGTLEERIDQLLESKKELAEKVIAGRGDDWLGELDLEAIRAAVALAPEAVG